jgi:putative chitinase
LSVHFDREIYFDNVRHTLFGGSMTEGQVLGQEALLLVWETKEPSADLRHASYCLATAKHETANEMLPIEEYGKGAGHEYGIPDKQTGQTYYGRGFVQLTWRENYSYATARLKLGGNDDLEWHADRALDPKIAAAVLYAGMLEGWFRPPNKLSLFFSDTADDAYGAREIVNGDKHIIPSWSNGVSIGKLIAGYHGHFLHALTISSQPKLAAGDKIRIELTVPEHVNITILVNGVPLIQEEE